MALAAHCRSFAAVRDSMEMLTAAPDSTAALRALLLRQLRLDSDLHRLLAQTGALALGPDPPAQAESLLAAATAVMADRDTSEDVVSLAALAAHRARFDSAASSLREMVRSRGSTQDSDAVLLELSLLDSLHTMLRMTLVQHRLAGAYLSSPQLDSLRAEVDRLKILRTLRAAASADLLKEVSKRADPLGSDPGRIQIRELAWQLRQAVDLLHGALVAFDVSVRLAETDLDRRHALQLSDAATRLRSLAEAMQHSTAALEQEFKAPRPDVDSLRALAGELRDDLRTQERSVVSMQEVLASLDDDALAQGTVRVLVDAALLHGNVREDLNVVLGTMSAQFGSDLQNYGTKILLAILLVLASLAAIRAAIWVLNTISERSATRRLFYKRLIPMARLIVLAAAVYVVLVYVFELDQRSLIAAGAAIGVAIGFAAQNILKNIFGGMIIVFDQPFQVGDKIKVGETYGEVVSIGLRTTRIVTPDDSLVSVPNSNVTDNQISNANTGALHCQVVVNLYIPGASDATLAKAIAYDAAANSKYVYLAKPIVVLVKDKFDMVFLTCVTVKAYVLDARYEFLFASDVTETAKAELRRQGFFAGWEHDQLPEAMR